MCPRPKGYHVITLPRCATPLILGELIYTPQGSLGPWRPEAAPPTHTDNSMKARPSYKPTFLDRNGPEGALRIRAAAYAFSVAGIILSVCIARGAPLIGTLLLALTLPPFAFAGTLWLSSGAGRVMRHMMEGGSSTPYEDQFSREQALVMQRGYAAALESFDAWLPTLLQHMKEDDCLVITADHGCDPTWRGTDHTREQLPVLFFGTGVKAAVDLGVRQSFADIGQTLARWLDVGSLPAGQDLGFRIH